MTVGAIPPYIGPGEEEGGDRDRDRDSAIILDGGAVQMCADQPPLMGDLKLALRRCKAAIFCRMTPSQKASIVRIVKVDFGERTMEGGMPKPQVPSM